jgi:nicotinamidase-related amidase/type 1 glutamine amidotransferase
MSLLRYSVAAGLAFLLHNSWVAEPSQAEEIQLTFRSRTETSDGSGRYHTVTTNEDWDPAHTALIVCDVWDLHHCLNAVRRVEEFGPRLNEVVKNARERGVTIIHAPSDCMDAYADHPARRRAMETPKVADLPDDIQSWCSRIPSEEQAVYPIDQSDGGEDDDPAEHADWAAKLEAMGRNPKMPWKQQSDLIEIDSDRDYISDKGDEVWSILAARGIDNVILTGVHTNMCVLGRPFGLRQMAKNGKNVVLMRDMTDTMYNPARWPYVSHFTGTDYIIEHIEKFVCPTITSDQFLGGEPFVFKNDTRPHLVIVMAEDEYQTEQTLPVFARQQLGKAFRVSLLFSRDDNPNDIPGLEILDDADALLVSVRRRPLPADQLDAFRRFEASGKPMIGIRTASHAFCLRNAPAPSGLADWPGFDAEVWGGNYTNHYGNDVQNTVQIVDEQAQHPIVKGLKTGEFPVGGSLYKVSPVSERATVLMTGRVEGQPAEPVTWTFERENGGRSFYTSLGYRTDFDGNPDFQRMLRNGIYWAVGLEVPEEFTTAGTIEDYRRSWMPIEMPFAEEPSGALAGYGDPMWIRCVVCVPDEWQPSSRFGEIQVGGNDVGDAYFNGEKLIPATDGTWNHYLVPNDAIHWGEANLITMRKERGIWDLISDAVPVFYIYPAGDEPRPRIDLTGMWQLRVGDDPLFATLPLPAKFAASTDVIFDRVERDAATARSR